VTISVITVKGILQNSTGYSEIASTWRTYQLKYNYVLLIMLRSVPVTLSHHACTRMVSLIYQCPSPHASRFSFPLTQVLASRTSHKFIAYSTAISSRTARLSANAVWTAGFYWVGYLFALLGDSDREKRGWWDMKLYYINRIAWATIGSAIAEVIS
jgi:hypothetical protein